MYPGVYAVGHTALSMRGRLQAALLYAGSEAALSHATGGWWRGVVFDQSAEIHVSSPRDRKGIGDLVVHGRRVVDTDIHDGLRVTTVSQTLVDLASVVTQGELRRALAEAEYRRLIDLRALETAIGRGRPGSAALRRALEDHLPQLAFTRSALEERFLDLCRAHGIPLPKVNARVCGLTVDAFWPDNRVIVELDGYAAHSAPAQVERDRRRELRLRAAGFLVLRYTWQQVTERAAEVAGDLKPALGQPA